jgi:hypothetical protein
MKPQIGLLVCALSLSAPSFAAEHIMSRSVKVAAKDTYKATKISAEKISKAAEAVIKFVFQGMSPPMRFHP